MAEPPEKPAAAGLERLEEDFLIVRKGFPDGSRPGSRPQSAMSLQLPKTDSASSSPSTGCSNLRYPQTAPTLPTPPEPFRADAGTKVPSSSSQVQISQALMDALLRRLERAESQQLASATSTAELREEISLVSIGLRQLSQQVESHFTQRQNETSSLQDVRALRADFDARTTQQQAILSALQAQSEQMRLQISEIRNELSLLRERSDSQVASLQSELRRELDSMQLEQVQTKRELRLQLQQAEERKSDIGCASLPFSIEERKQLHDSLLSEMQEYLNAEIRLRLTHETTRLSNEFNEKLTSAASTTPATSALVDKATREEDVQKMRELASCLDEVARQMQDLKQDQISESMMFRSRLEAAVGDQQATLSRIESCELLASQEHGRQHTESSALKARLQALELRLAAASLEKVHEQTFSTAKAMELLEIRLARLEHEHVPGTAISTTYPGGTVSSLHSGRPSTVASVDERPTGPSFAHLVGDMQEELRVELTSRLRLMAAEMKGEILAEVSDKLTDAKSSSIEDGLSMELERISADLRSCLQNFDRTQLVPRVASLEERVQRNALVLNTLHEERRRANSAKTIDVIEADLQSALSVGRYTAPASFATSHVAFDRGEMRKTITGSEASFATSHVAFDRGEMRKTIIGSEATTELSHSSGAQPSLGTTSQKSPRPHLQARDEFEDQKGKLTLSNELRDRLHSLVSALTWTLGQVNPETLEANQDALTDISTANSAGSGGLSAKAAAARGASDVGGIAVNRSRSVALPMRTPELRDSLVPHVIHAEQLQKERARTLSPGASLAVAPSESMRPAVSSTCPPVPAGQQGSPLLPSGAEQRPSSQQPMPRSPQHVQQPAAMQTSPQNRKVAAQRPSVPQQAAPRQQQQQQRPQQPQHVQPGGSYAPVVQNAHVQTAQPRKPTAVTSSRGPSFDPAAATRRFATSVGNSPLQGGFAAARTPQLVVPGMQDGRWSFHQGARLPI